TPFITICEFVARDQVWPGGTMRETGVEALSGSTSIVASEFLEGVSARLQPEKRLMLAVLEDAVSDFQKYATATSGRGRRLFANADGWLRSSADDQPLAFQSICPARARDPPFSRAGLQPSCRPCRRGPHRKMLRQKAKGILVFPSVVRAGFMFGGQIGEGGLRKNGKVVGQHNSVAASYRFQGGHSSS